jgi:hypothetical protein
MNVASNNTIVIIPKATKQTSIAMNPLMVRIFSQVIPYLFLDPFFYATMVIKAAAAIRTTSFLFFRAFPTLTSCITSWTLLGWTIAFRNILTTFGSYWTAIIRSIYWLRCGL